MKYKGEFEFKEIFESKVERGAFQDVFRYDKWRHRIEIAPGVVTPGYISEYTWYNAHFPTDLKGRSVLDVGANDGLNAFAAERMGASAITAIDIYKHTDEHDHQIGWNPDGIHLAHKYLRSKVDVRDMSIYDVGQLGRRFDVVLIADVLTWLQDMPMALKTIADICDDRIVIREGLLKEDHKEPFLRYDFPSTGTHMYTPNKQFFREALANLGFRRVEFKQIAHSTLYDHWVDTFPVANSDKPLKVYPDPWATEVRSELDKLRGQALMKVGDRYFIRHHGWVDKGDLNIIHIKPRLGAKALRALVGYEMYMTLKDLRYNYPRHSYTVIGYR